MERVGKYGGGVKKCVGVWEEVDRGERCWGWGEVW